MAIRFTKADLVDEISQEFPEIATYNISKIISRYHELIYEHVLDGDTVWLYRLGIFETLPRNVTPKENGKYRRKYWLRFKMAKNLRDRYHERVDERQAEEDAIYGDPDD